MIASPTRSDGLSAPPGSCGTYETTRPRRLRTARTSRPMTACPPTSIVPLRMTTPGRV